MCWNVVASPEMLRLSLYRESGLKFENPDLISKPEMSLPV